MSRPDREVPTSSGAANASPADDQGQVTERGSPRANAIIAVIFAVLVVIAVVVNQFDFGDAPATPVPEPTAPATEPVQPTATRAEATETAPPPTATDTPPTPTPTRDLSASAVGQECGDGCLLRLVDSDSVRRVIREAGGQPGPVNDGVMWLVAPGETAATIDLDGGEIAVVRGGIATLNLYIATPPEDQADPALFQGFGTVIDQAGNAFLVEASAIPAPVRGLANAGVDTVKFPPATVGTVNAATEKPELIQADVGGLANDVDVDSLTRLIGSLQATSSTDGSGIGTRQYLQPGNVMAAEFLYQQLAALGLTVRYEDFITPEGTLASNVIGEIPGTDPSAIYGVMAHLDSTSERFDTAPGADDNATGIAGALEIARILSHYELAHPVHIIFVNAEETGIIGSRVFAANAAAESVPYEGVFNLDSIGSNRRGSLIWLNSDGNSEWMMSLMHRVNEGYGLGQDIQSRQNPNIVADDNRLREYGIESILVARELFGESPWHHTSGDTVEHVSLENTRTCTVLTLLSLASLVITDG